MFLNNDVFSGLNTIKHIQYNLGNASSMLEYRDSYDLPSAIIKFDSLEPWGGMPHAPRTFQNVSSFSNPSDRFQVVSNVTKGIDLSMQMQYFDLMVSLTLNCKSQMQALNMSNELMQRMPVDRILNQFEFVSFFELDSKYLNPMVFDTQNDFITNLFLNVDPATNISNYSFSHRFTPLMKLTSVPQVAMDDLTQGAYQLTSSFELFIQVPQFIISDQLPGSSRSVDRLLNFKATPVSKLNTQTTIPCYYNYIYFDLDDGSVREIVAADPAIMDAANHIAYNGALSDGNTYSINADMIGDDTKFNYSITYRGEQLSGEGVLFKYVSGVSVCRLSGDLYGNVLTPILDPAAQTLSGIMLGNHNEIIIDNEALVFDLSWLRQRPSLTNAKLSPSNWTMRFPATRDLYSVATNINAYRSTLDFANTTIDAISIIEIATSVITKFTLTAAYTTLPDGSFSIPVTLPIPMTIGGRFNKSNSRLDSIGASDPLYDVLLLHVTPTWDYLPYGANQFDAVNLDLGGISNTAIPSTQAHDAFIDKIAMLDTSYVAVYSTMPYTTYNSQYTFSITISSELATLDPNTINTRFEIYFIYNGQYMDSAKTTGFMLDLNNSTPTILVFKATEDFRLRVLDNISKYSPLYFGIVILP